jgi:protein-S-isoprenylcysteine O-methyltransferase Ste14
MGLAMHFCVALTAAAVFYLVSRGIPALVDRAWIAGIVFGFVWLLVMYRGVIPLSQVVRTLYLSNVRRTLPPLWPLPFFVHIFCVGLPIALAVRDFGPAPRGSKSRGSKIAA